MSVSSRRAPWPYSLLISGVGVRTRGDIIGRKVQALGSAQPTSQEYGQDDVYRERSYAFRSFLGLGEPVQRGPASRRYRYGLNMWFAGRQRGKGPKWNVLVPPTTGAISDTIEALHGGVLTQFLLAGRYILRRTDDTSAGQVVSRDFGGGRTITSAARFKAPAGTDALYATLDNGDLWEYDGAVWAGPAAAGGTWTGDALLCAVVDNDFWIKDTANSVRRATATPMTAANYSGQFTAGDGSQTITGLAGLNNALFAFTENGKVFTFNSDGSSNDLAPGLATTPTATNGSKLALDTRGFLYFRNGGSWHRLTGLDGGTVEPIGPERLLDNDTEVTGVAQCFAWYGAYYGFFGVYNSSNGASYLVQFGDWLPAEDADGTQFVETFNGALVKWAGKQISSLRVHTIAGAARLYCGFTDGSLGWVRLPQNTPNPFSPSSGCEFADGTTGASECYWPRHTMLADADTKAYLDFSAFGTVLSSTNSLQVSYRTDFAASYTALGTSLTQNGQQQPFPENTVGNALDVKETFISPSSASTPVIESLVLREQLRPALRLEYLFNVIARHRSSLRDGSTDRKTPEQTKALVKSASETPASVQIVMPDETNQHFHSITYQETIPPDTQRYGMAWDLAVSFVQYRTNEVYGTVDRLGPLTVNDLGTMTVNDLGVL